MNPSTPPDPVDRRHFLRSLGACLAFPLAGCAASKAETAGVNFRQPRPGEPAAPERGMRNPDLFLPSNLPPGTRVTYNSTDVSGNYIAITFDDGPHPTHTPRLLDILKQRNVKATFYVIGTNVSRHPQIVRRILAEGHEIGNHTLNHPNLSNMGDDAVNRELTGVITAMRGAAPNYRMNTMRPPYGALTQRQREWIFRDYRYPTIMWSVDPQDWRRPGPSVVTQRILSGTRSGGIVLAHDIHGPTIDAMPATFDGLLGRGFRFVTISQLIGLEQRNRPVGSVYSAGVW